MQEQRFKDAKKAIVTPLMIHMANPSSLPQPEEPWLEDEVSRTTLDSSGFDDRRLKKPLQLEEVVAAMEFAMPASTFTQEEKKGEELEKLQASELANGLYS